MVASVLGWGYDLAVYDCAILGQLEVDLVAVNVDGLDGKLVAFFQLQRCAGVTVFSVSSSMRTFSSCSLEREFSLVESLEEDVLCSICVCHCSRRSNSQPGSPLLCSFPSPRTHNPWTEQWSYM